VVDATREHVVEELCEGFGRGHGGGCYISPGPRAPRGAPSPWHLPPPCCSAGALSSMALAAAQLPGPVPREKEPPSQTTRMQEKHLPLTVQGCIRGKRLLLSSLDGTANLLNADELALEGSKDLLQQLRREHEGHDDELTGTAILKP